MRSTMILLLLAKYMEIILQLDPGGFRWFSCTCVQVSSSVFSVIVNLVRLWQFDSVGYGSGCLGNVYDFHGVQLRGFVPGCRLVFIDISIRIGRRHVSCCFLAIFWCRHGCLWRQRFDMVHRQVVFITMVCVNDMHWYIIMRQILVMSLSDERL